MDKLSITKRLLELCKRLLGLLKKQKDIIEDEVSDKMSNMEKVSNVAQESIGKDLCNVSPELGCVVVLNEIFRRAIGEVIDGDNSTYRLGQHLLTDKRFEKVSEPQAGTLILSVTGTGNGTLAHGHGGVFIDRNHIVSNNSLTGLVDNHYNHWSWKRKFEQGGGFPTQYWNIKG